MLARGSLRCPACLVGVARSWGLFITCWTWRNLGNFTY